MMKLGYQNLYACFLFYWLISCSKCWPERIFLEVGSGKFICGCELITLSYYSLSPFRALEKKLIGGVTLNHLAWAALGGGISVKTNCNCSTVDLLILCCSTIRPPGTTRQG